MRRLIRRLVQNYELEAIYRICNTKNKKSIVYEECKIIEPRYRYTFISLVNPDEALQLIDDSRMFLDDIKLEILIHRTPYANVKNKLIELIFDNHNNLNNVFGNWNNYIINLLNTFYNSKIDSSIKNNIINNLKESINNNSSFALLYARYAFKHTYNKLFKGNISKEMVIQGIINSNKPSVMYEYLEIEKTDEVINALKNLPDSKEKYYYLFLYAIKYDKSLLNNNINDKDILMYSYLLSLNKDARDNLNSWYFKDDKKKDEVYSNLLKEYNNKIFK